MSFSSIAQMAGDAFLRERITACAATEGQRDPVAWASVNAWAVVAAPGWAGKWDSALAAGNPNPGNDPAVITDGDILSSVQSVRAAGEPTQPEEPAETQA